MISNNPVKGSWLDIVFSFIYMTSNNPVKWLLVGCCISFISNNDYYMLQKNI